MFAKLEERCKLQDRSRAMTVKGLKTSVLSETKDANLARGACS